MPSFSVNEQYFEYKACTQRFVQWITTAAIGVDKSTKRLSNTLHALSLRTKLITGVTNSDSLMVGSEELMQGFEESMNAGFRAIQLRKFVHQINLTDDPTSRSSTHRDSRKRDDKKRRGVEKQEEHRIQNESHAYCIRVLEECYVSLKRWWKGLCKDSLTSTPNTKQATPTTTNSTTGTNKADSSFNMFSVLQSLEDIDVPMNEEEKEAGVRVAMDADSASSEATIEQIDASLTSKDGTTMTDLRITALCLLYDMVIAMKEVKAIWQQVREEKISILSAVTVTMTAYRQIHQRCCVLELKYPSLESAEDFYQCALVHALNLSEDEEDDEEETEGWPYYQDTSKPTDSSHLPDWMLPLEGQEEFFVEQFDIIGMLLSFSPLFRDGRELIYRRGHFGIPYHEESAPLRRCVPNEIMRFLAVEMPILFNNYIMSVDVPPAAADAASAAANAHADDLNDSAGDDGDDPGEDVANRDTSNKINKNAAAEKHVPSKMRFLQQPLTHEFYKILIPHFERGLVSMSEVFLVHCWIQSVYVLQDPETHFLGRSLYRLRKFGREIEETVKEYLTDPTLNDFYDDNKNRRDQDQILRALSFFIIDMPYGAVGQYSPLHVNPLLQGCVILDKLMNYLHLSTQCLQGLSSFHRALCHLVHALQQEGFLSAQQLEKMPMLTDFLHVYNPYVFVGGTTKERHGGIEVSKGQYETQYLLASHVTAYGLSQHVQGKENNNKTKEKKERRRHEVKVRQSLDPSVISPLYRCLRDQDYSGIFVADDTSDSSSGNTKRPKSNVTLLSLSKLLHRVKDLTEKELFETKYFTIKLTNYHLQCYRIFATIRRDMSNIFSFEKIYQMNYESELLRNETRSYRHVQALELSIIQPIFHHLDHRDASKPMNNDPLANLCPVVVLLLSRFFITPMRHPLATPSASSKPFLKFPYTNRQAKTDLIEEVVDTLNEHRMIVADYEVNVTACGHVKVPFEGFYRFSQDVVKSVWLKDEFGHFTSSQLHKAADNAISKSTGMGDECFSFMMDQLEEWEQKLERILKKAPEHLTGEEKQQLQETRTQMKCLVQRLGRENPVMFTQGDGNTMNFKRTILDHAINGIWRGQADADLVEWILQMWGYNFNMQMIHSPLQVAIIGRESWAVELLLRQDTGGSINFQSPVDGNTALHYAALAGDEAAMFKLSTQFCNSSLRNHRGQLAKDVIPMSLKEFQRFFQKRTDSCMRQEEKKLLDIANNGPEKRTAILADAAKKRQNQRMKQLQEEEKQHVPTAEDIAKTERAQKELLEMLEKEEAEEAARKAKKGNKNGNGGSGGAKKSSGKKKK